MPKRFRYFIGDILQVASEDLNFVYYDKLHHHFGRYDGDIINSMHDPVVGDILVPFDKEWRNRGIFSSHTMVPVLVNRAKIRHIKKIDLRARAKNLSLSCLSQIL